MHDVCNQLLSPAQVVLLTSLLQQLPVVANYFIGKELQPNFTKFLILDVKVTEI